MTQPAVNPNPFPVAWEQGQHVALVGDTGTGKTYLLSKIVSIRNYVVILRTKPDDIKFAGFRKARKASVMDDWKSNHILLDPVYEEQGEQAYAMFERAWRDGGWTIVIDELWYVERLGLRSMIERLLTQGRSKRITVVVGMQRPVWVSRFALSQCTHLFSFRVEGRDGKVLADAFTKKIVPLVDSDSPDAITGHDFAYFNRNTRAITVGNANAIRKVFRVA